MNEFEIIEHFFNTQIIQRPDVILGIGDDCALVKIPSQQLLAITTDTLVEGIHFPLTTTAKDIGHKALAVNLSDLAAMGAIPTWVTLALTLPSANLAWLTDFCHDFFALATRHNVQLIGGDLSRGPLSITVQAQGFVTKNQAITRRNANPGDLIYVTNMLGDAGLGLMALNKKIELAPHYLEGVITRLNRPQPLVVTGQKLRGIASTAIDISDGLAADLNHLLQQSRVGAVVHVDQIPLSPALKDTLSPDEAIALALGAGDDYELCFTVPPANEAALLKTLSCQLTCIGIITATLGLELRYSNGNEYILSSQGYQHFQG